MTPARTDWFPADVLPVRVGEYECKYAFNDIPQRRYFDGTKWKQIGNVGCCFFGIGNTDGEFWRGLASDPAVSK